MYSFEFEVEGCSFSCDFNCGLLTHTSMTHFSHNRTELKTSISRNHLTQMLRSSLFKKEKKIKRPQNDNVVQTVHDSREKKMEDISIAPNLEIKRIE